MRTLILLRHAKSSWDDRNVTDHARPLNPRGRQAATAMRQVIADLGLAPDMIRVSTAKRTLETLQALEPWPETPLVEPSDDLYLASAENLLACVQATPGTVRSLMLVGHNPGLHEFALQLLGPQAEMLSNPDMRRLAEGYPSGAMAEFSVSTSWQELATGGGRLVRFICPRDLVGS